MEKIIKIDTVTVTFDSDYIEELDAYYFDIKDDKGSEYNMGLYDSDQVSSRSDEELVTLYEYKEDAAAWEDTVEEAYDRACASYEDEKPYIGDFKDEESYQKAYNEWLSGYPEESEFD